MQIQNNPNMKPSVGSIEDLLPQLKEPGHLGGMPTALVVWGALGSIGLVFAAGYRHAEAHYVPEAVNACLAYSAGFMALGDF